MTHSTTQDNGHSSALPAPVTVSRIAATARALELDARFYPATDAEELPNRGTVPAREARVSITHDLLTANNVAHSSITVDSSDYPTVRSDLTFTQPLPLSAMGRLAAFINEWNSSHHCPTLMLNVVNPECVMVYGHTSFLAEPGLSDTQLASALNNTLGSTAQAVEQAAKALPALAGAGVDHAAQGEAPHRVPVPVTSARIQATLAKLGIDNVTSTGPRGVAARVNGVPLTCALESGATLVAQAHWDAGLAGRDFTKAFLVCNDFNRKHDSATAFCRSTPEGLQVRMDYRVPAEDGLSNAQLELNLRLALRILLHGIDEIAVDAEGYSPVHWPN